MTPTNQLYFGDNFSVLRDHIPSESVDLIYLDPPFNSNATYSVLFKERSGEDSTAQITAFDDPLSLELDQNTRRLDGGLNHICSLLLCAAYDQLRSNRLTPSGP